MTPRPSANTLPLALPALTPVEKLIGAAGDAGRWAAHSEMKHSPYCDAAAAATYDRLALPYQFSAPARDLVDLLRPPPGGLVLDVGSGTGAAALPAAEAVGPEGSVVALDASAEMLRLLQTKGVSRVVIGEAPNLPFRDGSFHAVMSWPPPVRHGEADDPRCRGGEYDAQGAGQKIGSE